MDMFNKLKSAVSNVLPGNPLSRDFDIDHQVASAGPGLLWKVYSATKKSTKEAASVFLFEKKSVDRYSRRDRDIIMEVLRVGVQQLTKLRHPKILAVIQPMEESRESLAFATEPVFASLSNVLGNMTSVSPVPKDLQDFQIYDVEIKHGLLQVTEGLSFLHNDAKILHRNLCPEAIVLTKLGCWKLAGFEFCVRSTDPQSSQPPYPFHEWRSDLAPVAQPHLDFLAPEFVLTMMCSPASDMFSLGLLIHTVFNKGKTLFQCRGELSAFKQNAEELRHLRATSLSGVPDELRENVKLLLNMEPTMRPDAAQMSKVPFFEDLGCVTLQYIDTLFQRENIEKSNFFKGLPKVITKLPKRVSLQRILPALFKEAMNADMVPFLLPSILLTAKEATETEYRQQILPHLIPLFRLKEPVQVVLLFLQNMSLLLSKTPNSDIQNHVLPMIFRSLENDSPQIQELCLNIIPTFVELIEYHTLKNSLVPRIKKLCLCTSVLTVRVNCLLCMGQLLEHMDKWFVLDEILPFLHKIPTREPAVLMTVLGIHKVAFEASKLGISKDTLASKVLPFLIPLSVDSNLNLSQFNAFVALIHDMLGKMEEEHRGKLEQLHQLKQEQKTLEISRLGGSDGDLVPDVDSPGKNSTMMDKFLSGFGIGGFLSGGQAQKVGGTGGGAISQNGTALSNSTPASASPTASPVNLPSKKTSMTLEEKQRLAKQQEQHQRLKSQTSLTPTASSTTPPRSASKDLTSTLMESNMAAMARNKTPTAQTSAAWGSSPAWNNTTPMSMGYGGQGMGYGVQQGQGFGSMGMNSAPRTNSPSWVGGGAKPDLSAFDDLMGGPQKPKPSLNQMGGGVGSGGTVRPQGMMGMGPASTMGNAMAMGAPRMGLQAGFGVGQGGAYSHMGRGDGGGMQGMGGGLGMGQVMSPTQSGPSSQKSSSNSLDDLLG